MLRSAREAKHVVRRLDHRAEAHRGRRLGMVELQPKIGTKRARSMLESDPLQAKTRSVKICASASSELGASPGRNGSGKLASGYSSAPADSAQATQGNSKPESRNAFWSNVKVQEQPALVPSAAMTASANEPCPSLSAIMALKTSCSFSTTSTSV
jgi:hypothetical protein